MRTGRVVMPAVAMLLLVACGEIPGSPRASGGGNPQSREAVRVPVRLENPRGNLSPRESKDRTYSIAAFTDGAPPAGGSDRSAAPGRARPNRLARSNSPYLLAHAHNPVDWYPWGPEAFEIARRENKPIFLSVGYASCYWCHVMERLVFSNEAIARRMNEHFVNVKVDREERPDVDEIYMTALQVYFALSGSPQPGGWPLSMFLTPDGKPFRGGTYFPPEDVRDETGRIVRPAFTRVIDEVSAAWKNDRETIDRNAETIAEQVRRVMEPQFALEPAKIDGELVATAVAAIKETVDHVYGGVDFHAERADAPKFPAAPRLALLHYQARRHGDAEAAEIVALTLDGMAAGGIRDHLGGGFHRYSVDRRWHVPHFEKMLYDQAQLAEIYAASFRATGHRGHRAVALETLDFVLGEMTGPRGGFYSAIDAETDGVEGAYYAWTPRQLDDVLGPRDAALFGRAYGLDEPKGLEHGYVLHLPRPLEALARELSSSPAALEHKLGEMRAKLLAARQERKAPLCDDKVLAGWNGLMIAALAGAGRDLDRPDYVAEAERAALFVLSEMRDERGRLMRTWRNGRGDVEAYLDDYACVVHGLVALHAATGDARWMNAARRLTDEQIRLFHDPEAGGFFFTAHDHEKLIARTKNAYDDALPAATAVTVRNLLRIAAHFDAPQYRELAKETLNAFAPLARKHPGGMSTLALAAAEFLDDPANRAAAPAGSVVSAAGEAAQGEPASPIVPLAAEDLPRPMPDEEEPLVKPRAYLSVDRLPAGQPCRIILLLDVAAGWHINQNPAKPANLIATQFSIKTVHGTRLSQVRYPPGTEFRIEGIDEPVLVYDGRVVIHGVLTAPAESAGKTEEFELIVRFQACNDRICRPPDVVKLSGKVVIAGPGEPVQSINEKLFRDEDEKERSRSRPPR